MTDQEAREFLEQLAVPNRTQPPPCPLCAGQHQLELRCVEPAFRPTVALAGQPS